jgi:hypothetical protein
MFIAYNRDWFNMRAGNEMSSKVDFAKRAAGGTSQFGGQSGSKIGSGGNHL